MSEHDSLIEQTKTPRVDAKAFSVEKRGRNNAWTVELVYASDARELERELSSAEALNKMLNRENQTQLQMRKDAEARVLEVERDAKRLDWLELQYVTVRLPARYGSREGFSAQCGEENEPSDIRAKVDRALLKERGDG